MRMAYIERQFSGPSLDIIAKAEKIRVEGPSGVTATYVFDLDDVERYLGATAE